MTKKRATHKRKNLVRHGGSEDDRQRSKFRRGGRIEAYTWGEAQKSKNWP